MTEALAALTTARGEPSAAELHRLVVSRVEGGQHLAVPCLLKKCGFIE